MSIITDNYRNNNNNNSFREPEEKSLSRSSSIASFSSLRKRFNFGRKVKQPDFFSEETRILSSKKLFEDHASLGGSVCQALNNHFKFKNNVKYFLSVVKNELQITNQQTSSIETMSYKVCLVFYEKAKKQEKQIKFKVYSEHALNMRSLDKHAIREGNAFSLKNKQYHPICSLNFIYDKLKNGLNYTVAPGDCHSIDPTEMCSFFPVHRINFIINSDIGLSQENIIKGCFEKYQQIFDENKFTKKTSYLKSALPFDA